MSKHHFESSPCLKEMPGLELDAVCQKTRRGDIIVNFPKQAIVVTTVKEIPSFAIVFKTFYILGEGKNFRSFVGSVRFK